MSDWVQNSTCNATCAGGIANATRTVLVQPANGGAACPALTRTDYPCNTQPCFQNCTVSNWTDYSNCSVTCGTGVKYRNRTVLLPPYGAGAPCPVLNETTSCTLDPCPVDCVVGNQTVFWEERLWQGGRCRLGRNTRERHSVPLDDYAKAVYRMNEEINAAAIRQLGELDSLKRILIAMLGDHWRDYYRS